MNQTWRGARGLRKHLVSLEDLTPHPRNPRRGDVEAIAASLDRFGQVRPILLDGERQIVAGNHTYLAARQLGWTHIAATVGDFASPEEARAYLLADNRLPELGEYERRELLELLEEAEAAGAWAGTGYQSDDLEDLRFYLDQVPTTDPEVFRGGYADAGIAEERQRQIAQQTSKKEVVLALPPDRHAQFGRCVRVIQKEQATEGVAATVLRAARSQAELLNQG